MTSSASNGAGAGRAKTVSSSASRACQVGTASGESPLAQAVCVMINAASAAVNVRRYLIRTPSHELVVSYPVSLSRLRYARWPAVR
jgi:hypothetical protein